VDFSQAGGHPYTHGQVKQRVGGLCRALTEPSPSSITSPNRAAPRSKKEQEKGRWSQATACRSLRPAVLGVCEGFAVGGRIGVLSQLRWSETPDMQINKGIATCTQKVVNKKGGTFE